MINTRKRERERERVREKEREREIYEDKAKEIDCRNEYKYYYFGQEKAPAPSFTSILCCSDEDPLFRIASYKCTWPPST